MADLNDAPRDEIVQRIEAGGNGTIGVWPDLAEPATVSESVREVRDAVEGIDVLINDAGIAGPTAPAEDVSLEGVGGKLPSQ